MKDNIPTGTLIKNTQLQFNLSVKMPPSEGPIAAANPPKAPMMPPIIPCFSLGTKLRPSGIATGTITAAEIPCIILKATNV
ncbi:Uncharacterised protein [Streptococcus pneumoniae]|nr:Uncharacterised protein [Streptococcus pneumoniae]